MNINPRSGKAIYRLMAILLAVCLCAVMFTGCKKPTDEAVVSTSDAPLGVQWNENNVPFINEDFEGAANCAQQRGEVTFEVVTAQQHPALHATARPAPWNPVNFSSHDIRGNEINAWAKVKCGSTGVHLTLQYDLAGTTSYSWIGSVNGFADKYTSVGGSIAIPAEATGVFVYVEADNLDDIYVDDVTVKVVGDYTPYLEDVSIEYATFADYESLKELYADYFTIGCAIPTSYVGNSNTQYIELVTREFNAITLENEFKPEGILDAATSKSDPAKYNEAPAVHFDDALIATLDYCRDNSIQVRGHVLTWHSQTPEWLFCEDYDTSKGYVSRELMLKRMENYIKSVLTWCEDNYPGVFYAWDITNEAIDDGTCKLRSDVPWTKTVGDDWVQYAFKFARQYAGKGVKLFYNDYNASLTGKCAGIINLLKPIAAAGNIDGVGMQGHISTTTNIENFVKCAYKYADELGVVLNITELDIEIPKTANAEFDQGLYFYKYFKALIDAKNEGLPLESVTIWGLCDNLSWKAGKSPLVFRGDLSRKPAFDGMVCAATGAEMQYPDDYVTATGEAVPIRDNYEGEKFVGRPRFNSTPKLTTDEAYEGKQSLLVTGGESYDGYSIDINNFIGKTIKFSAYVKSVCPEMRVTGEIDGTWPTIAVIDTSSGDWVLVEGTYEVPADFTEYSIYFETTTTDDFYIDNLSIELAD